MPFWKVSMLLNFNQFIHQFVVLPMIPFLNWLLNTLLHKLLVSKFKYYLSLFRHFDFLMLCSHESIIYCTESLFSLVLMPNVSILITKWRLNRLNGLSKWLRVFPQNCNVTRYRGLKKTKSWCQNCQLFHDMKVKSFSANKLQCYLVHYRYTIYIERGFETKSWCQMCSVKTWDL